MVSFTHNKANLSININKMCNILIHECVFFFYLVDEESHDAKCVFTQGTLSCRNPKTGIDCSATYVGFDNTDKLARVAAFGLRYTPLTSDPIQSQTFDLFPKSLTTGLYKSCNKTVNGEVETIKLFHQNSVQPKGIEVTGTERCYADLINIVFSNLVDFKTVKVDNYGFIQVAADIWTETGLAKLEN